MVREHLEGLERVLGKGFGGPGTALSWGCEGQGEAYGRKHWGWAGRRLHFGWPGSETLLPRADPGGRLHSVSHQCPPTSGGSSTCVGGGAEGAVLHPRPQGPHREQGPPTGWSALELVPLPQPQAEGQDAWEKQHPGRCCRLPCRTHRPTVEKARPPWKALGHQGVVTPFLPARGLREHRSLWNGARRALVWLQSLPTPDTRVRGVHSIFSMLTG